MGTGTGVMPRPQHPAMASSCPPLPSLPFRSAGQGHKEAKSSFLSHRIKPVEGFFFFSFPPCLIFFLFFQYK